MHESNPPIIVREAEYKAFRDAALELLQTDERSEQRPIVMLLWGIGGIGKSTLTGQFKRIIETEAPFERDLAVVRLDWELAPSRIRVQRPDPEAVMDHIVSQLRQAGYEGAFKRYDASKAARRKAEQEATAQLSGQGDRRLAPLAGIAIKVVAEMVRSGGTLAGIPGAEAAATAMDTHGEAAVQQALTLLRQKLGDQRWELAMEPHTALARALGEGLREAARRKPLVFIQDTYEIVDSADPEPMREAIYASGPRLLWLIAGRRNLAPSSGRFVGYNSVSDRVRLRARPELGEFARGDIVTYFAEAVPEQPLPPHGAERVEQVTLGIPLAVRLAAEIWRRTGSLEELGSGGTGERDGFVYQMAERFLVHCTDGAERSQLYALALQRRPNAPLLAAMCGSEARGADAVIRQLAERYDFIFAANGWLHDKVRYFLREQMKGRLRTDTTVQALNERALGVTVRERNLAAMKLPSWEERLDSPLWSEWALDALHHHLWLDPADAGGVWPAYLLAGLAYDRAFAGSVLELAEELAGSDSKRHRDALNDLGSLIQRPWSTKQDAAGMKQLARLWGKVEPSFRDDTELRGVMAWAEARLLLDQADANAQRAGEVLLALLPTLAEEWTALRALVGEALYDAARKLLFPEGRTSSVKTPAAAPFMEAAHGCKEWDEEGGFWNTLGVAMRQAGRQEEAIEAHREAIRLDPNDAVAHNNLGIALREQGDLDGAIAAYREAIRLDPTNAAAPYNLGLALRAQGDLDGAIAAYREAIRLDPTNAEGHSALGTTLRVMERWEEAEAAHRRALSLDATSYGDWTALAELARRRGDEAAWQEAVATARPLVDRSDLYNAACFESSAGNTDEALRLLAAAIRRAPGDAGWARQDPDFHWIRDDPRFEAALRGEAPDA